MKFATRISSMRRTAWKACRSCSADSDSMWPDSFASSALAGWIRSPRASSTFVTGCWASQSISRSGCSVRSSSAIATSRCAWPRPIGEEMYSARRRRPRARVQAEVGRPRPSTKSRSSRLILTGSRAFGICPEPCRVTNSPAVASASAAPCLRGRTWSSSPWITSVGQRTREHVSLKLSVLQASPIPRVVSASVSGSVSSAQPMQSSICLLECGSVKHLAKKNSRNPR